jgi:hypothetical protein
LLAELRAQIGSSMEEAGGVAPGIPAPGVVESVAAKTRERSAFHVARVALGRSREGAASSFQENDLVLLEKKNAFNAASTEGNKPFVDVVSRAHGSRRTTQRYHAFGVVEGVETGSGSKSWSGASVGGKSSAEENDSRVLLKIRVCLVEDALSPTTRWLTGNGGGPLNAPDERERRDGVLRAVSRRGAAVTISRVASLTPPLREMAALLATCRAGGFAGAASAFLRPSRAAPEHTALFAGTRAGDLPPAPEGADLEAWASTMAGLNPPQRDAVRAAASFMSAKRGVGSGGATTQTRVVLVQGPPGTGKTRVIAATVEAVLAGSGSGGGTKTNPAPPKGVLSPAKYGAAAVAARRRQDDRRRRMSVDGDAKQTNETSVDPSRRRRILVCAQSNSAVDELVARLAGAFGARADRTLVRLGREEVTREDALPFLVTRLVDDRRRAESAEIGRGEARGGGGGGGAAALPLETAARPRRTPPLRRRARGSSGWARRSAPRNPRSRAVSVFRVFRARAASRPCTSTCSTRRGGVCSASSPR